MKGDSPTHVAVYELVGRSWQRAAEFRLHDHRTVTLTMATDHECTEARHWYTEGIPVLGTAEVVTTATPTRFMRALLQPFRASYSRVTDESPGTSNAFRTPL